MDAGSEGVSVYAEAKGEYTKQLCQYLIPALQQFFLDLLEDAKAKEPDGKKVLSKFQDLLEAISEWNMDKVQRETTALTMASHCDYLEELLTAVFIAHTKVLSAIRLTNKQKKLQITIPKLDHFLHRTLTECARLLWTNTFLFSPNAPSIERQKNLRLIEKLLYDGVHQAIRGMLPVKNILREYLKGGDEEDDAEEEDDDEEEEEASGAVEEKAAESTEVKATEAQEAAKPTEAQEAAKPTEVQQQQQEVEQPAAPLEFTGLQPNESGPAIQEEEPPLFPDEEDAGFDDEIKIFEGEPAEGLDDFEDLDAPSGAQAPPPVAKKEEDDILPMDFEELA